MKPSMEIWAGVSKGDEEAGEGSVVVYLVVHLEDVVDVLDHIVVHGVVETIKVKGRVLGGRGAGALQGVERVEEADCAQGAEAVEEARVRGLQHAGALLVAVQLDFLPGGLKGFLMGDEELLPELVVRDPRAAFAGAAALEDGDDGVANVRGDGVQVSLGQGWPLHRLFEEEVWEDVGVDETRELGGLIGARGGADVLEDGC